MYFYYFYSLFIYYIHKKNKSMEILLILLTLLYLINALIAISCTNLIFSVFSLVFMFFFGILLFLFVSAEYIMVIFLIVYLGAIVVISLFVTMPLDVKTIDTSISDYNKIVAFFCILLFSYMFICFACNVYDMFNYILTHDHVYFLFPIDMYTSLTNVEKIGFCLFYEFGFLLIVCGVIMMIVIVGCFLIINKKK